MDCYRIEFDYLDGKNKGWALLFAYDALEAVMKFSNWDYYTGYATSCQKSV